MDLGKLRKLAGITESFQDFDLAGPNGPQTGTVATFEGQAAQFFARIFAVPNTWTLTTVGKVGMAFDGEKFSFFENPADYTPE